MQLLSSDLLLQMIDASSNFIPAAIDCTVALIVHRATSPGKRNATDNDYHDKDQPFSTGIGGPSPAGPAKEIKTEKKCQSNRQSALL
jgi:hypothetical protein